MRTENEFNAKLGSLLKQQKDLFFRKLSDKYQVGMSDFLLIKKGRPVFIECKFKKELKGSLSHPFSGPQISFMKQAAIGGAESYGLLWVDSISKMILVHELQIPSSGTFKGVSLDSIPHNEYNLNKDGVKDMLFNIFGGLDG